MIKKHFSVGLKAMIVKKGKVLITKRSSKINKSDFWDFPGGRIEWGESVREGLLREVKEETNLDLQVISNPLSITTFFNSANRDNQVMRIIFLCSVSGKVKLNFEQQQFKWISPEEASDYIFLDKDYNMAFERFTDIKDQEITEFINEGMLEESMKFRTVVP